MFDPRSINFNAIRERKRRVLKRNVEIAFGRDALTRLGIACENRLLDLAKRRRSWLPDPNWEERSWIEGFLSDPTVQFARDFACRGPLRLLGGDVAFRLLPFGMLDDSRDENTLGVGPSYLGLCETPVVFGTTQVGGQIIRDIKRLANREQLATICMYMKFHSQYFDERALVAWNDYWKYVCSATGGQRADLS